MAISYLDTSGLSSRATTGAGVVMTACTEWHTAAPTDDMAGEGQKGMTKEAQS